MITTTTLIRVILGLVTVVFVRFAVKLCTVRLHMRRLRQRGLPMPPHNLFLGHLSIAASISKSLPHDAHANYLPDQLRRRYLDLGPVFYFDVWPFSDPMLVVTDPAMIAQFCQGEWDQVLPKHPGVKNFMRPMTGGYDLNSLHGQVWRRWRKLFSPGFGASHITSLLPSIVDEVLIFKDILMKHAKEERMFSLEDAAVKITLDLIGKVVLDTNMNNQRGGFHYMTTALLSQLRWASFGMEIEFLHLLNPLRYFYIWNNTRKMNRYINQELDSKYNPSEPKEKSKTIVDLALNSYTKENPTGASQGYIDPTFRKYALSQMKAFIFAGHDATATTICYMYLLLSRHPDVLTKLCAEHDAVLGARSTAAETLVANPSLLNKLPYTLAVIKETLRLFPVVSAPRIGRPHFHLTDASSGRSFPTDGCLVWANHHGLHNNPLFWDRVTEYLPQRFLIPDDDDENPLKPLRNAWRPFEFGPRACIGTELAMAEIKTILALTVRDLDVRDAYEEYDVLHPVKQGQVKSVNGERAYQVQRGSAHPADGFPARALIRK